jgi:biopolymer transport protein ExbB
MLEKIIQGKSMMVPLLACSLLGLAVIFDRLFAFLANRKVDTRSLRAGVLDLVGGGRVEEAAELCASTPGPVSAVLLAGLQAFAKMTGIGARPEAVRSVTEKTMDDFAFHAMSAVEKRLWVLSTVGSAAPLFGMTGTVTGMISAFGTMAAMGGLDAAAVAGGIAEALITTAAGLLIALGAVIPYHYFSQTAGNIELEIEEASSELLDFITVRGECAGAAAGAAGAEAR